MYTQLGKEWRSTGDVIVFALLVSLCSLILLFGFVYYLPKYKKENKKIFTLKKIVIFSLFFSFFIFQSLLTRFMASSPVIPFSLDNITIIAVGFLFGPLEGIIYGITADLTRVGLSGWAPQLIPAFMFSLLGMMSGMFGRLYFNGSEEISDFAGFFGMQFIIVFFASMTAIAAPLISIFDDEEYRALYYYLAMSAALASLIVMELLLLVTRKSKNRTHMKLILYITIINTIDRVFMGYFMRSFSQYWYWGYPLGLQMLARMVTSSYLVPARIIASVALIRACIFAIEQRGGIKNWA